MAPIRGFGPPASRLGHCVRGYDVSGAQPIGQTVGGPTGGCVERDGLRIAYLDWGDPSSDVAVDPLIVLHPNGFCAGVFDPLARRLGDRFRVVGVDLRGHGAAGGDKVSGGYFERWDVLGAFDYLVGRGVGSGRIGLMGFSMGAATSILAAAEEPRITAVAADSPFADASDLIAREAARKTPISGWLTPLFMPATKLMSNWIYGIDIGALVPEQAVAGLGYPVLVIHGIADERIPWRQGQRVASAAAAGSSIWLVPGVDHVDAFLTHPDEYVKRVSEYFDSRFR